MLVEADKPSVREFGRWPGTISETPYIVWISRFENREHTLKLLKCNIRVMGDSGRLFDDAQRFSPAAPSEKFVYGSCSPYWHAACDDETAVEQWLSVVQSQDIERVCCLLAGRTEEMSETSLSKYREAFGEEHICHAPTRDKRLIQRETLVETILPFLSESVAQESPVVVHCLSGIGRTGQVHACWLTAARDYDPEEAINTVCEMGRDPTTALERESVTEEDLYSLLESMPALDPDKTA
jgi:protein-tyrosine phosphatase